MMDAVYQCVNHPWSPRRAAIRIKYHPQPPQHHSSLAPAGRPAADADA